MAKVVTNKLAIKKKIAAGAQAAKIALVNEILSYSDEFIPEAEGTLKDSGYLYSIPEEGKCIWETPYAKYQWYGMRKDGSYKVKNYTTEGTGMMWAVKATDTYQKELQQVAQNAFTKGFK